MLRRRLIAGMALLCATCVAGVGVAAADTGTTISPQHNPPSAADGWQAGTCTTDVPECSPATPDKFFTQAAGHPPVGLTQFIVANKTIQLGPLPIELGKETTATVKDIRVDLPVGLSVNPQATTQCTMTQFTSSTCPLDSAVGQSGVTVVAAGLELPPVAGVTLVPVYNLVPENGEPALFGFSAAGSNVFLKSDVEWNGDYHEGFTIAVPKSPLGSIIKNRLVFNGTAGGAFLTNPSTCHNPAEGAFAHTYSTFLRADSTEAPNPNFPSGSTPFEAALPPGVKPEGCGSVPFKPGVATVPGIDQTDSPSGAQVEVSVPFDAKASIANSNVQTAKTSLPVGMGLNPSGAEGLVFCEDGQLGKGTRNKVSCPAKSKIGTATIETPPLPAGSLAGTVYLGKQLSRNPESGDEYRIFVDVESARYGVSVRLIGNVSANRSTGRLTATFAENPQLPFTAFKVKFDQSAKSVLTNPPTCGPNTTNSEISPYSGTAAATPSSSFALSKAPGGGACAKTMAARPFTPGFSTHSSSVVAGAFSPFSIHVGRSDGQQEVKGVNLTLPAGVTGKLVGIPYCPQKAIAQAEARSGAAEAKNDSCPDKSKIGVATVRAGSGSSPVTIKGNAFLAGPYNGAPLSLAVVTPATAGPFDLGTVVVRVALFVDPETARINAVSDPIPDVFGGAKLSVRSIDVNANKKEFILNGTSCGALATEGAILGGGADPTNPAAFVPKGVNDPFQTTDCGKLKFRPKLSTRIFGKRKKAFRAQNPKFRATLIARGGDANLDRTVVTLPKALILDQSHIKTVCTRPALAAGACPKNSIYGHAAASTPLLGDKLSGPVYLVPGNHILPDLLVDLRGQVDIRLRGTVESTKAGRLRNIFSAPDVPVSKFVLTMKGGGKGLLTNTRDLCKAPVRSNVGIKAQNTKKVHSRPKIKTPMCKGKHRARRG